MPLKIFMAVVCIKKFFNIFPMYTYTNLNGTGIHIRQAL